MNLPPGPRTTSQELAAQAPTMPAPLVPSIDERKELAAQALASDAPPTPDQWAALKSEIQAVDARTSRSDKEQNLEISALRSDVIGVQGSVSELAASLEAFRKSTEVPARNGAPVDKPADKPADLAPVAPPKTLGESIDAIHKTQGSTRLWLIAGAIFETLRILGPYLSKLAGLAQ